MRSPEELEQSALAVLDLAFATPAVYERKTKRGVVRRHKFAEVMAPLLSGGNDSFCACHVASRHPKFGGEVNHIDTGIGAEQTRRHVEEVCRLVGWKLRVYKSPDTYERFVRERGFPGPGMHQWAYVRLKERCVRTIVKGRRVALVTGCRRQESTRRMGHVEPLKIGEEKERKGRLVTEDKNRYWSAPCFDWSAEEQRAYMDWHDLPRNPLKDKLGVSGECFCGAFAKPDELRAIRRHAPDVATEIDRLAEVARECGRHSVWGTRPDKAKGVVLAPTGPLCSGCDQRAVAAGLVFTELIPN